VFLTLIVLIGFFVITVIELGLSSSPLGEVSLKSVLAVMSLVRGTWTICFDLKVFKKVFLTLGSSFVITLGELKRGDF